MSDGSLAAGQAALGAGRWADARAAFEAVLAEQESAEASAGLGAALWWLGESAAGVTHGSRAYAQFRREGDLAGAVQSAVWLGITYKADFANYTAANGWLGRAERLLGPVEPGPLHGWVQVARAYRMADLDAAARLTGRAAELGRAAGDADLELTALAQLGLITVGQGRTAEGFALIDEAMAAALAGERSNLETVVYACCDMLNACELASDAERAAQWCRVADEFVDTYGCPFLYAECRILYGSVLSAQGRWDDAEEALRAGLRITDGTCPGLHTRALTRLAALRVRQGRLEDAGRLLDRVAESGEEEAETAVSIAALLLARGDAAGASQRLVQRLADLAEHRAHLGVALDLLVDAHLARGDVEAAEAAAGAAGGAGGRGRQPPARRAGRRRPGTDRRGAGRGRRAGPAAGRAGGVDPARPAVRGRPHPLRPRMQPGGRRRQRRGRPPAPRPGRLRAAGRGAGGRPGGGRAAGAGRARPDRSQGRGPAHRPGAPGARAAGRRAVQPGDRRAPAREPQDRRPPRQPHPHQAGPAQPGRGRGLRRERPDVGHLPDARRPRPSHARAMSESTETFQIPLAAAELYEAAFVPAFFAQWAPTLCEAAGVAPGRRVLDVACGTGIVARTAADQGATVTGVDLNEAMLTVARRVRPELDWRQGNAQDLPLADGSFDVVMSQMALMFFPEPAAALAEMARVVRPGGTVAVLVPGALERQAAFAPFVEMAARHAGPEALDLLTAYFRSGDLDRLAAQLGRQRRP